MKNEGVTKRVLTHAAMIVTVILIIAIASHFLLRMGTRHGARRTVPEFKGISLPEAELLAQSSDLNIYINDSLYVAAYAGGTVLDQLPAAGVEVKPGRTVYVVINAYGDRMVDIPYVAGRSLRQAKNMLDVAGLEIANIKYTRDMATNYVLEQSFKGRKVEAGAAVEAVMGAGIDLIVGVSEKDPYTRIPNVIGLSLKEAKSRIWESGLNVGRINIDKGVNLLKDKNAKVYIQGAAANSSSKWGASMSVTVTLDQAKVDAAVAEALKAEEEYEKMRQKLKEEAENNIVIESQSATSNETATSETDEFFD